MILCDILQIADLMSMQKKYINISLISAWISKYTHYEILGELPIHSQTSTVQPHIYWMLDYLSMLRLKLIYVNKRTQGYYRLSF